MALLASAAAIPIVAAGKVLPYFPYRAYALYVAYSASVAALSIMVLSRRKPIMSESGIEGRIIAYTIIMAFMVVILEIY
ncbi:MAG: hypothetical protein QXW10_01725 [Candidatus Micrarchaeaceae archaeon]